MKYDSAAWHYNGRFPDGLPPEAGATHIGMFMAWAIINRLVSEEHEKNFAEDLQAVRERKISGRDYLFKNCNGALSDSDLSETGCRFAFDYYCNDDGYLEYIDIYDKALCRKIESFYQVEDSWDNFDLLKAIIDRGFQKWLAADKKRQQTG